MEKAEEMLQNTEEGIGTMFKLQTKLQDKSNPKIESSNGKCDEKYIIRRSSPVLSCYHYCFKRKQEFVQKKNMKRKN